MNRFLALTVLIAITACHSRSSAPAVPQEEPAAGTEQAEAPAVQNQSLQRAIAAEGFSSKGTIEAVTEVPVYSRINEQIVGFDIVLGQRVRKGEVVARLSQVVLNDKIARNKAELEKAEYQYQAILMGQGYKRQELDKAPEDIKRQARINSGYNTALASLQQLEHELSYCTITAPVTGAVSRIEATLYSAATPGVPLFYIVDTEHLKVCFDVLENELPKFQKGAGIQVISVAYPTEVHEAEVSAISPVVEKNGMVHLEATLQPHPHLMPGMTAIVTKSE
ncbi:MAG: efflux RND transporter periplasmic adaptor subunit [Bacteroidales bacterium]|nr:efflux RND transporter periplasmic adaptor subunit [Bacteroidales bacterium]